MWRKAVKMLVLESIYALPARTACAPDREAFLNKASEEISAYIEETITEMPWFFKIPILAIATLTALIGIIITGRAANKATATGRRRVMTLSRALPLYGNFSKLVRSLSLLAYFDIDAQDKGPGVGDAS